jgi:membrane protein DedA with SNARE-associated domain
MNPILMDMLKLVDIYGYVAIFIFTFLGAFALPIPTGSMMIACGFLATIGVFDLTGLLIVGILGNLAGDHAGYWLARRLHGNVEKLPLLGKLVAHKRFKTVASQVHDHPWVTIVLSRFMTAVAPSVNVVAGLSRYPYGKFWIFEGSGEVLEVAVAVALGWWFGQQWLRATEYFGVVLILIVLGIVSSAIFWKWLGKSQKKHSLN